MGELSGWTTPRIAPQTLADQDQGSAVEVAEEATTHHMAAVEDQSAAAPQAMAEVHMVQVEAAMAAGMAAVAADKVAHHMVEDNHMAEVGPHKAVVVAMVSINNTKVNKVAILDNPNTQPVNKGTGCSVISRYPQLGRESLFVWAWLKKVPPKKVSKYGASIIGGCNERCDISFANWSLSFLLRHMEECAAALICEPSSPLVSSSFSV
jgi:hypothetical protein